MEPGGNTRRDDSSALHPKDDRVGIPQVGTTDEEEDQNNRVPILELPHKRRKSFGTHEIHSFFSEPSVSEDDLERIRAPHRAAPTPPHYRRRMFSSSSDDDMVEGAAAPFFPPVPNSPGNTSLSSWDSPAFASKRKVLLQWPVPVRRNRKDQLSHYDRTPSAKSSLKDFRHGEIEHSNSMLSDYDDFELRLRSSHQQQSKEGSSFSSPRIVTRGRSDSSMTNDVGMDHANEDGRLRLRGDDSVFRFLKEPTNRHQYVNRSSRLVKQANTRLQQIESSETPILHTSASMTFSDSEHEESGANDDSIRNDSSSSFQRLTDPDATNSADDEKTVERPPRVRNTPRVSHRRTRSGDAAAANLVRRGTDWKGMELDRIPMPEIEDDEDENDDRNGPSGPRQQRIHRVPRYQDETANSRRTNNPMDVSVAFPHQGATFAPYSQSPRLATNQQSMKFDDPAEHLYHDTRTAWLQQMAALNQSESFQVATAQPTHNSFGDDSPSNSSFQYKAAASPIVRAVHSTEAFDSDNSGCSGESDESDIMRVQRPDYGISDIGVCDAAALAALEDQIEHQRGLRNVVRHHYETSPFANLGKVAAEKFSKASFMPSALIADHDPKKVRTFLCPRCGSRQREFFSVQDAPSMMSGPASYLASYFTIYVIASLFIFGLEEGWNPLDCIYFAVVTLTTAGLGDFKPTTYANKLICSIFIFFGVSCVGLLLGSYIAGILDERARIDRKSKLVDSCPNCARIRTIKDSAEKAPRPLHSSSGSRKSPSDYRPNHYRHGRTTICTPDDHLVHGRKSYSERSPLYRDGKHSLSVDSQSVRSQVGSLSLSGATADCYTASTAEASRLAEEDTSGSTPRVEQSPMSNATKMAMLGSPVTRQILGRQRRTRHQSFDTRNGDGMRLSFSGNRLRHFSDDRPVGPGTINENVPLSMSERSNANNKPQQRYGAMGSTLTDGGDDGDGDASYGDDLSETSSEFSDSSMEEVFDENLTKIKTAKYVFLTLKQALVNSMTIIAAGSLGFYFIEKWGMIDSWYFTTVFLTTVGYGDIVPVTKGGKLFATVYILVAGTILLHNMSSISLIPLELRKRRLERAVLTQFGDQLDDAALRELATGPVIQRLKLAGNKPGGLDECTREMFSLAMLVRMGKVNEEEVLHTFAAFRRLDVVNAGVLNSRSIIAAMVQKRRNLSYSHHGNRPHNMTQSAAPPVPPIHLAHGHWNPHQVPVSAYQQPQPDHHPPQAPTEAYRRSPPRQSTLAPPDHYPQTPRIHPVPHEVNEHQPLIG